MQITDVRQDTSMIPQGSKRNPMRGDNARAQVTVRLEFSTLLKTLYPAMRFNSILDRGLLGVTDQNARFGEIPSVQVFLEKHRIPYDLSWAEADSFDAGVRQVRYREGEQGEVENWIFPWEGLTLDEVELDQLVAGDASSLESVLLLQWLAETSTRAFTLQPLNQIPLSIQQRLLVGLYTRYAKVRRNPSRFWVKRVSSQFAAFERYATGIRLRVSDLRRGR